MQLDLAYDWSIRNEILLLVDLLHRRDKMKIKITERARKMYGENCPYSTEKCESLSELDYKIQRCVDLGDKIEFHNKLYAVQYYKLQFIIDGNEIVSIHRNEEEYYHINKKLKHKYYLNHCKVMI